MSALSGFVLRLYQQHALDPSLFPALEA